MYSYLLWSLWNGTIRVRYVAHTIDGGGCFTGRACKSYSERTHGPQAASACRVETPLATAKTVRWTKAPPPWRNDDWDENNILYIFFQALALLCMMCAAPAYHSTQHWFLLVVTLAFLGTIFFSLYHLCLDTYLKTVNVGWLPTVSTLFPIQRSK